jgi:hypothetical protein
MAARPTGGDPGSDRSGNLRALLRILNIRLYDNFRCAGTKEAHERRPEHVPADKRDHAPGQAVGNAIGHPGHTGQPHGASHFPVEDLIGGTTAATPGRMRRNRDGNWDAIGGRKLGRGDGNWDAIGIDGSHPFGGRKLGRDWY